MSVSYREARGLSWREICKGSKMEHSQVRLVFYLFYRCEAVFEAAGPREGRVECMWTGVKQVISVVRSYRRLLIYPVIMMICKVCTLDFLNPNLS